jgi:hypothetical protein
MTVRFKDPLAARACVAKFDGQSPSPPFSIELELTSPSLLAPARPAGRFFAQRRIGATLHDGAKVRFKRSGGGGGDPELDDEANEQAEKERLDKFRAFLEKDA